jgi:hypothetical protein
MRPKFKGVKLVGGYHIPYREAASYKRRIKRCRRAAKEAMASFCPIALAQWQDSQDGEAVCGLDAKGNLIAIIHLDSDGLDLIDRGIKEGNLAQLLKEYNDNRKDEEA